MTAAMESASVHRRHGGAGRDRKANSRTARRRPGRAPVDADADRVPPPHSPFTPISFERGADTVIASKAKRPRSGCALEAQVWVASLSLAMTTTVANARRNAAAANVGAFVPRRHGGAGRERKAKSRTAFQAAAEGGAVLHGGASLSSPSQRKMSSMPSMNTRRRGRARAARLSRPI